MLVLAQLSDLAGGPFLPTLVAAPVVVADFLLFLIAASPRAKAVGYMCIIFSVLALVSCFYLPGDTNFYIALMLLFYSIMVIATCIAVVLIRSAGK